MVLDERELPVFYGEGFRKFSLGASVIADIERHPAANAGTTVMFMKVLHDLFKRTTADENTLLGGVREPISKRRPP
jgi:hypothetical protein